MLLKMPELKKGKTFYGFQIYGNVAHPIKYTIERVYSNYVEMIEEGMYGVFSVEFTDLLREYWLTKEECEIRGKYYVENEMNEPLLGDLKGAGSGSRMNIQNLVKDIKARNDLVNIDSGLPLSEAITRKDISTINSLIDLGAEIYPYHVTQCLSNFTINNFTILLSFYQRGANMQVVKDLKKMSKNFPIHGSLFIDDLSLSELGVLHEKLNKRKFPDEIKTFLAKKILKAQMNNTFSK